MADGPWLPPFFLGPGKQWGGKKDGNGEKVQEKGKSVSKMIKNKKNVRGGHDSLWCGGGGGYRGSGVAQPRGKVH
jgi:hypothetical protein